jgi:hypothetical protein
MAVIVCLKCPFRVASAALLKTMPIMQPWSIRCQFVSICLRTHVTETYFREIHNNEPYPRSIILFIGWTLDEDGDLKRSESADHHTQERWIIYAHRVRMQFSIVVWKQTKQTLTSLSFPLKHLGQSFPPVSTDHPWSSNMLWRIPRRSIDFLPFCYNFGKFVNFYHFRFGGIVFLSDLRDEEEVPLWGQTPLPYLSKSDII